MRRDGFEKKDGEERCINSNKVNAAIQKKKRSGKNTRDVGEEIAQVDGVKYVLDDSIKRFKQWGGEPDSKGRNSSRTVVEWENATV